MKFILLMLSFAFFTISCKSPEKVEDAKLTKVKLLGYDMRMCACCGGHLMSFDLNAEKYRDTMYLVNSIVKNNIITDSTVYPMIVNVEWEYAKTSCGLQKIDILRIEK